jgi:hypothetical protein
MDSHQYFLIPLMIASCGSAGNDASPAKNNDEAPQGGGAAAQQARYEEGRDYVVLERLRVIDPSGFERPMEAYSILVPRGWKSRGGITWQVGNPCMTEVIHNRVTVTSPDGAFELNIHPAQQWDWWDDPMMLQAMLQNAQHPLTRRCPIAQPLDAGQFLQGPFAQELGAQVVNVRPAEELVRVMREQAEANNQAMRAAGVQLEYHPTAAMGELRYPDGSGGVAIASVTAQISWMPNYMTGGQSASWSCTSQQKVAMKCPAGKEEEARRLLSTIMASFRINPEWQAGVTQVVRNVAAVELRESQKRARIQQETSDYISDLRKRTWEESQASRDRTAEAWSQLLRGVETWREAGGERVELSAGYNEAWSHPNGTYILSNDPNFDPSVVFQDDWRRMSKHR